MTSMIKPDQDLTLFFIGAISAVLGELTIVIWFFPLFAAFLEKAKENRTSLCSKKMASTINLLQSYNHLNLFY